ncbi:MAG: asparagine synthase-related protein [Solirubrobacteraceae bacterium]
MLRAGMAGLLPDAVRLRPRKALFDSLLVDCLTGPDGASTRRLLSDPRAELGAYLDMRGVERALFENDRLRREQPFRWMWQLWRLTTAECWLRGRSEPRGDALLAGLQASAARVALQPIADAASVSDSYVFPP